MEPLLLVARKRNARFVFGIFFVYARIGPPELEQILYSQPIQLRSSGFSHEVEPQLRGKIESPELAGVNFRVHHLLFVLLFFSVTMMRRRPVPF